MIIVQTYYMTWNIHSLALEVRMLAIRPQMSCETVQAFNYDVQLLLLGARGGAYMTKTLN